jgi:hypothetical protein
MKPISRTNDPEFGVGFSKSRPSVLDNGNLNSPQSAEPSQENGRVTDHSERHTVEQERATASPSNRANRFAWEMFGFGSFLVFIFVGFFFALYVIWAKCNGSSPF